MFGWLKKGLRNFVGVKKTEVTSSSLLFQNTFGYLNRDLDKWKPEDFFDADPWLGSVVNMIAETVGEVPMGAYVIEGGKRLYIENEATKKLLDSPNEDQDWVDFLYLTMIHLELTGNVYWEMSGDEEGDPQLKVLAPACITKGYEKRTGRPQYRYRAVDPLTARMETVVYEADQIIEICYPNNKTDFKGRSRLESCKRDLIISYEARVFNQSWLENGSSPDGYIKTRSEPDSAGWKRLRERRQLETAGYRNAGKRDYVVEGEEFIPTTVAPKDMQYLELLKQSREVVLAAMRVPPAVIGIFEFANYANSQVQMRLFYEGGILPRLNKLTRKLTKWARMATNNQNLFLGFRTEDIKALQDDKEVIARIATTLAGGAIVTTDEGRAMMNIDPLKPGQKVLVNGGLIPHDVALADTPSIEDMLDMPSDEEESDIGIDADALAREINALSLLQQRLSSSGSTTVADLELIQQARDRISMLLTGKKTKTKPKLKIYDGGQQEQTVKVIDSEKRRVIYPKRRLIG